jgi:transposase-like protein
MLDFLPSAKRDGKVAAQFFAKFSRLSTLKLHELSRKNTSYPVIIETLAEVTELQQSKYLNNVIEL